MKDKLHLEIDNLALEFIINDVAKKRLHKIVDEIEDDKCIWKEDSWYEYWETTCGITWTFPDSGVPCENDVNYCPNCGKPVYDEPYEEASDEDSSSR